MGWASWPQKIQRLINGFRSSFDGDEAGIEARSSNLEA